MAVEVQMRCFRLWNCVDCLILKVMMHWIRDWLETRLDPFLCEFIFQLMNNHLLEGLKGQVG
jgi:hypothetical protein